MMDDLCFMADVSHGLALFPGTEEEVQTVIDRICRQYDVKNKHLTVAMVGRDVDEKEAVYMKATCRLPRRVQFRLSK